MKATNKPMDKKVTANERNLSKTERKNICDRWAELLNDTYLIDTVELSGIASQNEIALGNGDADIIQIRNINMEFYYYDLLTDLCDPDGKPKVIINVIHSPTKTRDPKFLEAIGKAVSDHVGKVVRVDWLLTDEGGTHLICADKESAWNAADHLLGMDGY